MRFVHERRFAAFHVFLGLFSVLILARATPAVAAEPEMTFDLAGVTAPDMFRQQMRTARQRVRDWWGPTFEDTIKIVVAAEGRGPSMALVPAWRGERGVMLFTAFAVNRGVASTIHEMVHVYAPNGGRMLAEGLATYQHDRLGGAPSYPNNGRDLHKAAAARASTALLLNLERIATPMPLPEPEQDNYLIAASFVRFLIETYGEEKFRELYALSPLQPGRRDAGSPGRWRSIYGEELGALADQWVSAIKG